MQPADLLRRARLVELRARRLVEELFAGPYRSVFRGRGIEFDEIREYQPGDDVRSIDWHATARTGRVQVKRQVEERHQTLLLAVDVSGSGEFGSAASSKRELAAELAAVLALSAVLNNDRVGLLLFTDRIERFLPPRSGRFQALAIVAAVLGHRSPHLGTRLDLPLNVIGRAFTRRITVLLLSDFLAQGYERALRVAARRHNVVALHLQDRWETALPDLGWLVCEDAESGELVELNTAHPAARHAFALAHAERVERLAQLFRHAGVDSVPCRTDRPFYADLLQFFANRHSRRAR